MHHICLIEIFWHNLQYGLSIGVAPYFNTKMTLDLACFTETFTLNDALESIGFGKFHCKLASMVTLSWVSVLHHVEMSSLWFTGPVSCSALPLCEQIASSIEVMITSLLAPQLRCEWRLPSYQVALITSVRSSGNGFILRLVIQMFALKILSLALGDIFWDGDQLTCVGAYGWQIWQKSSESYLGVFSCMIWGFLCKIWYWLMFSLCVSVVNRVFGFARSGLPTLACWVLLLQHMAGSCSCVALLALALEELLRRKFTVSPCVNKWCLRWADLPTNIQCLFRMTLYSEFLPMKARGSSIMIIGVLWWFCYPCQGNHVFCFSFFIYLFVCLWTVRVWQDFVPGHLTVFKTWQYSLLKGKLTKSCQTGFCIWQHWLQMISFGAFRLKVNKPLLNKWT